MKGPSGGMRVFPSWTLKILGAIGLTLAFWVLLPLRDTQAGKLAYGTFLLLLAAFFWRQSRLHQRK